jgi:hypothetical protein
MYSGSTARRGIVRTNSGGVCASTSVTFATAREASSTGRHRGGIAAHEDCVDLCGAGRGKLVTEAGDSSMITGFSRQESHSAFQFPPFADAKCHHTLQNIADQPPPTEKALPRAAGHVG